MRKARFFTGFWGRTISISTLRTTSIGTASTQAAMALRDASYALGRLAKRDARMILRSTMGKGQRQYSNATLAIKEPSMDLEELESQSSLTTSGPSEENIKKFDPVKRSQARRKELPPSRYEMSRL
jgi:large subunit ribosomal protein L5